MAFFVELPKNKSELENDPVDDDFVSTILSLAKRIHMSFEELNMLRVKDFIKMTEKYIESQDPEKAKKRKRKATQADIDKFFG